jgi:hypothetical protein
MQSRTLTAWKGLSGDKLCVANTIKITSAGGLQELLRTSQSAVGMP